ncbi:ATP-binding protein [Paenibacillus sp. GCM10027626]|uniref:ATP-binding protein n=1 Tax=Paenibacillus sp. GCM10027626 TaxID=3273411 RepID=UPI0036251ACF
MKKFRWAAVIILVTVFVFALILTSPGSTQINSTDTLITEWEVQWISAAELEASAPPKIDGWHSSNDRQSLTTIPEGAAGAWVHIVVPPTSNWLTPGLLIDRLYGLNISVYENSRLVYQSTRDFDFERNNLLIPVPLTSVSSDLYIRIGSKEQAGVSGSIRIGEFNGLSEDFVRTELPNVLLGASVAFLALIMLLCSGYLNRSQRSSWIALSLFALSTGTLILTYSALPYIYFEEFGHTLLLLFDTSMYVLFPALYYYIVPTFEGRYGFFTKCGRWLTGYFAFCFIIMIIYKLIGEPFYFYYKLFTFWILAPLILTLLMLIVGLSIKSALRGNKNSIILSGGICLLALFGITDLVLFYLTDAKHLLFLWKIGIVCLIAVLIIILARRISTDHQRLLTYSKELELYNHQLQRTEKMKIISDLAASIAHEVRNPMQVTRGFLQLLSSKSDNNNKKYFTMAITELDRASAIITDFLTFAKPEMETIVLMDLQQELSKVETIMSPLTVMHGGVLQVHVPEKLYILGNPSKFKQAFINMVKNSTEALQQEGIIRIEAWAEKDTAVIRIADNGEGMNGEQLAKLGEPFFSTKTVGTGLGLMVTFRIIEVMKGTLEFHSVKGKGTEAIIRFPLADPDQFQT